MSWGLNRGPRFPVALLYVLLMLLETEVTAAFWLFHMQPPALLHLPGEVKSTSKEPSGSLCTSSESPHDGSSFQPQAATKSSLWSNVSITVSASLLVLSKPSHKHSGRTR